MICRFRKSKNSRLTLVLLPLGLRRVLNIMPCAFSACKFTTRKSFANTIKGCQVYSANRFKTQNLHVIIKLLQQLLHMLEIRTSKLFPKKMMLPYAYGFMGSCALVLTSNRSLTKFSKNGYGSMQVL